MVLLVAVADGATTEDEDVGHVSTAVAPTPTTF